MAQRADRRADHGGQHHQRGDVEARLVGEFLPLISRRLSTTALGPGHRWRARSQSTSRM